MEDKISKASGTKKGSAGEQTPPDVKVFIQTGTIDMIRMVGVGTATLGKYTKNTEHWRHATGLVSAHFTDTLTLTCDPFTTSPRPEDETSLDTFFTSTTLHVLTVGRVGPVWNAGARTVPTNRTGYLYWMADPDSTSNPRIGVLFELDSGSILRAVTFYRKTVQTNGQIWNAATIAPTTLTRVKKAGTPITEPQYIDINEQWSGSYTVMGF